MCQPMTSQIITRRDARNYEKISLVDTMKRAR
jgi:hypothetical protein